MPPMTPGVNGLDVELVGLVTVVVAMAGAIGVILLDIIVVGVVTIRGGMVMLLDFRAVLDVNSSGKSIEESDGGGVNGGSGDESVDDGSGDSDRELKSGMQRGGVPELKSHRLFGGQQTLGKSRHGLRLTWPPQGYQESDQLFTPLRLSPAARCLEVSLVTNLIIARYPTPTEGATLAIRANRPLNWIATLTATTLPRPWAAMG